MATTHANPGPATLAAATRASDSLPTGLFALLDRGLYALGERLGLNAVPGPTRAPAAPAAPSMEAPGECRCVGECRCSLYLLILRSRREEMDSEFFREVM